MRRTMIKKKNEMEMNEMAFGIWNEWDESDSWMKYVTLHSQNYLKIPFQ